MLPMFKKNKGTNKLVAGNQNTMEWSDPADQRSLAKGPILTDLFHS